MRNSAAINACVVGCCGSVRKQFYVATCVLAMEELSRKDKYDSEVTEFWVEIRTSGSQTKTDMEQIQEKRQGEGTMDALNAPPVFIKDGTFGFEDDNSSSVCVQEGNRCVSWILLQMM
jgi:hypothetical protein